MKKHRNNPDREVVPAGTKKFNWKLLLILLLNTAIVFTVYQMLLNYYYFEVTLIVYMAVLTLLVLWFVIYNRGFSRRGITVDMLPDTMTPQEKTDFVGEAEIRLKKSKWMLTVILPFVFTFLYDAFSWFIEDYILTLFK